ncbi:MAG: relaxase/mobilization nuclease domain-containing protein [Planctomycetota bacterium]|jgi:hypothetical protein|nr:relaxase/mobilization nuclease domain-containing protein [Planctomycetota bacterium]
MARSANRNWTVRRVFGEPLSPPEAALPPPTARWDCRMVLSINRYPGWRRKERAPYPGLVYFAFSGDFLAPKIGTNNGYKSKGGLGYSEHQTIVAIHRDTDHTHIHLAVNKIHLQKLTLHSLKYDYAELQRICRFGITATVLALVRKPARTLSRWQCN